MIRRVSGPSGRLAAGVIVALAFVFAVPGVAAVGAASGNNGTVKIHDGATEIEPIVENEPHVCTFHLHFFFADPSQSGTWEIQAWSPGTSGDVVLSGAYDTTDDGEDRQPAGGTYSLPDGHYKLFWDGRNDENVKHKTFWVRCDEPTSSSGSSPSSSASASPTGSEEPASSERSSPGGGVLSLVGTPPATPPATEASSTDAGGSGIGLALAGLLLAAAMALATVPRSALRRR